MERRIRNNNWNTVNTVLFAILTVPTMRLRLHRTASVYVCGQLSWLELYAFCLSGLN